METIMVLIDEHPDTHPVRTLRNLISAEKSNCDIWHYLLQHANKAAVLSQIIPWA